MKKVHLAYTLGGVLSRAVLALRESGLHVQVRALRCFGSVESTVRGVFIEVEDSRIRDAYESKGISVSIFVAEKENTATAQLNREIEEVGAEVLSKPTGALKAGAADGTGSRRRDRSSGS